MQRLQKSNNLDSEYIQVSALISVSKSLFIKTYEQTYEGHTHIMNAAFNPKDTNTILSACLDCTVKMRSLGSSSNFSMEAHDKARKLCRLLLKLSHQKHPQLCFRMRMVCYTPQRR